VGFVAKMSFKEQIDDKTITIVNVYFLQVFLTFWGLLIRPVDASLAFAPIVYFGIVLIVVVVAAFGAKALFEDKKERSIATVAAIIGNTGNLGIPINIAIFGEESIPYATIVNLVNVFVVYGIGVFYYSRGSFDAKTSLLNIVKLPVLWAALVALALSAYEVKPNAAIMNALMMGAYASMTMQLFLFGVYLYGAKIREVGKKLVLWVMAFKFVLLPSLAFVILANLEMEPMIKGVVFIELMTPLAVANVNLASLYDCKPKVVASLVLLSSVAFLGIVFVAVKLLAYL
jgi:malate permease and related proteins